MGVKQQCKHLGSAPRTLVVWRSLSEIRSPELSRFMKVCYETKGGAVSLEVGESVTG